MKRGAAFTLIEPFDALRLLRASLARRRRFTLVELLVIIAIIGVLAALLMPMLGRARDRARVVACTSNMRQSLVGIFVYAADYQEYVWNYGPGAHDHIDPEYGRQDYRLWYKTAVDINAPTSGHEWGEGRVQNSYWRGILWAGNYAPPAVMGCVVQAPTGWYNPTGGNHLESSGSQTYLKNQPYVYRGRATSTDLDITVYTGGNIAGGDWNTSGANGEPADLMSAHRPKLTTPRPGHRVLLNCPCYVIAWPTSPY